MRRRTVLALPGLAVPGWLAGCATAPAAGWVDAGWFPAEEPAARRGDSRDGVWLSMSAEAEATQATVQHPGLFGAMTVPVGGIVRAAAGRAVAVARPADPAASTVTLDLPALELASQLLWVLPVPYLGGVGKRELRGRVAFSATLRMADGTVAWTRRYDSGSQIWPAPDARDNEGIRRFLLQQVHLAAWGLAQQLARDVADWLQAERLRPRVL